MGGTKHVVWTTVSVRKLSGPLPPSVCLSLSSHDTGQLTHLIYVGFYLKKLGNDKQTAESKYVDI